MIDEESESPDTSEAQVRKVSKSLRRYWEKNRLAHNVRSVGKALSTSSVPDAPDLVPFSSLANGGPLDLDEVLSLLLNPRQRHNSATEVRMAAALFSAWLAGPTDRGLHRDALRSYVLSVADKLEGARRPASLREQAINRAAAQLNERNQNFYLGIYSLLGGYQSISVADHPEKMTERKRLSAQWLVEALLIFSGFHAMWREIGPDEFQNAASARKGYKISEALSKSPTMTDIKTALGIGNSVKVRESKTIENNLSGAEIAPMIAYAAYQLRDQAGKRLLATILYASDELPSRREDLATCMRMARFVHDRLTPAGWMVKNVNEFLPDSLEFTAPDLAPSEIEEIRTIAAIHPGRPRKR